MVALNRLRRDPRTRKYVARRTAAEGKSKREAMRCLKLWIRYWWLRATPPVDLTQPEAEPTVPR